MITPQRRGKEPSITPTPSRRRSMQSMMSTPSSRLTTPTQHSPTASFNPTPESGLSSSSITNVKSRRSIRRVHPKTNEPLARIVSATTSSMTTVGRTPEEISASYEQWMKLAADNKINASNSWHLGLIDYFADMGILKHGDGGINFQKASCTLDGCVKIYSTRVDAVALETEQLVSGLNDTKQSAALNQSNAGDEDDTSISGPTERPKRIRRANTKTLEKDFSAINVTSTEAEFMIDPLFRKTCAEFDEGGAHSLLLSRLTVGGQGEIIFDSSDVVTYQSKKSDDLEENGDFGSSVVNLSMFPSLAKLATIDLSKKTICNSLKNIVLSDDIQGIESLTDVLELELMDDVYHASAVERDVNPSSHVVSASLDQESNYGHITETVQDAHLQVLENDQMPEYVPISLNALSSEDFYSEANVFDDADEYENEIENVAGFQRSVDVDYNQPNLHGSETRATLSVDDDQFLMVPLPRSHGIFASSVNNGPASKRIAKLRSSMHPNDPCTTTSKPIRKPLETIQFRDAIAPKLETLFAKGTSSINIPRPTTGPNSTNISTDLVTMHNMHVSTNPFDPSTLSRSCLRPSTTFPRSLARDLKQVGAVPRMIELLGGVQEEVPVVSDDDDDNCLNDVGETGTADWDVEMPVMDDGEEDIYSRTNAGGLSDPVVMDDIARFGNQEEGLAVIQPIMDFSLDPSKLSMDGLDMFGSQPDFGFGNLVIHGGGHSQLSYSNGPIPFRRNRMGLTNLLKRSKRVDVKRLKENIWKTIRQKVILAPHSYQSIENEQVEPVPDLHSENGMSFSNMIQLVGQEYSVDHSKDISIPFYFICILHLANEKDLELDAQAKQTDQFYGKFWPKLWLQRRSHAIKILRDHSIKIDWVADFGCNECALAQALLQTSDFTRLTCVDLDRQVFEHVNLCPTPSSVHEQSSNRARPMTIDLFQGSIVEYDHRMVGIDAITLLEVIEHLDPEPLSLLPQALFEYYRPKLVIISTPNQEYNVHFSDPNKMRDPDHRFEWTRAEFQMWCTTNADKYKYQVEFTSVGDYACCRYDTNQHADYGQATQFATFKVSDYDRYPSIDKWPIQPIKAVFVDDPNATLKVKWNHLKQICYPIPEYAADLYNFTLPITPNQLKVLNVAVTAMLDDLAPMSDSNTTPLIKWCTPAHLWRLSEIRQAWRTPYAFMQFLRSPFALEYVGLMYLEPENKDLSVLEPENIHLAFWYGHDGGKVSRYVPADDSESLNEEKNGVEQSDARGQGGKVIDQVLRLREIEMGLMNECINPVLHSHRPSQSKSGIDTKVVRDGSVCNIMSSEHFSSDDDEDLLYFEDHDDIHEVEIEWLDVNLADSWAVSPVSDPDHL